MKRARPGRLARSLARYFPGYQAGASLKHRGAAMRRPESVYFPGYQAGASLKQLVEAHGGDLAVQLPRLPSRGLIEAAAQRGSIPVATR